ncbi:MAG TPA: hypothetical protein VGE27_10040 [Gemmatimonas sp.]|uniref:hypothetical protein n=1 Tax=Gemmatimonas sp. TaxID=1962908 RepID=UPI002ED85FFD
MSTPAVPLNPEMGSSLPSPAALPPYAAPVAGGNASQGSARLAAPYVPAAWRTHRPAALVQPAGLMASMPTSPTPVGVESLFGVEEEAVTVVEQGGAPLAEQESTDDSLPWIDAFLSTTPAMAMPAISEEPEEAAYVEATAPADTEPTLVQDDEPAQSELPPKPLSRAERIAALFTPVDSPVVAAKTPSSTVAADSARVEAKVVQEAEQLEAPATPFVEALAEPFIAIDEPSDAADAEDWPLAQAASELDAMAHQLEALAPVQSTEPSALFAEPAQPEPLPVWSDDDMVDIMPVRQPLFTPRGQSALRVSGLGAQVARRDENAEAAAHALELLAGRVRAGELPLPGYEPRMGDAAALVAALAALLGVKLS